MLDMTRYGTEITIHSAAASLPSPGSPTDDAAGTAISTAQRPDGAGHEQWEVRIYGSTALTITDLRCVVFDGARWATLNVVQESDVLYSSLAVSAIGTRFMLNGLGRYDRLMFTGTISTGNVTITIRPVVK